MKNKQKKEIIYYLNDTNLDSNNSIKLVGSTENKLVCYIIENVDFRRGLYLYAGENTQVIFRNCNFHQCISVHSLGEVVFEDNEYYGDAEYPIFPKDFFNCEAKSLKISKDLIANYCSEIFNDQNSFGINIKAKFVMIEDAFIAVNDINAMINIECQEIILFASMIDCRNISIKADDVYTTYSSILASEQVVIRDKNGSEIDGVESPRVIYNGENLNGKRISLK